MHQITRFRFSYDLDSLKFKNGKTFVNILNDKTRKISSFGYLIEEKLATSLSEIYGIKFQKKNHVNDSSDINGVYDSDTLKKTIEIQIKTTFQNSYQSITLKSSRNITEYNNLNIDNFKSYIIDIFKGGYNNLIYSYNTCEINRETNKIFVMCNFVSVKAIIEILKESKTEIKKTRNGNQILTLSYNGKVIISTGLTT
jgi:hypothetical protein